MIYVIKLSIAFVALTISVLSNNVRTRLLHKVNQARRGKK